MKRLVLGLMLFAGMVALTTQGFDNLFAQAKGGIVLKRVDVETGVIVISSPMRVKKKTENVDQEFRLADNAVVTIIDEDGKKKELKGKEALKELANKIDASVTFKADKFDITELSVGALEKKKK